MPAEREKPYYCSRYYSFCGRTGWSPLEAALIYPIVAELRHRRFCKSISGGMTEDRDPWAVLEDRNRRTITVISRNGKRGRRYAVADECGRAIARGHCLQTVLLQAFAPYFDRAALKEMLDKARMTVTRRSR